MGYIETGRSHDVLSVPTVNKRNILVQVVDIDTV